MPLTRLTFTVGPRLPSRPPIQSSTPLSRLSPDSLAGLAPRTPSPLLDDRLLCSDPPVQICPDLSRSRCSDPPVQIHLCRSTYADPSVQFSLFGLICSVQSLQIHLFRFFCPVALCSDLTRSCSDSTVQIYLRTTLEPPANKATLIYFLLSRRHFWASLLEAHTVYMIRTFFYSHGSLYTMANCARPELKRVL